MLFFENKRLHFTTIYNTGKLIVYILILNIFENKQDNNSSELNSNNLFQNLFFSYFHKGLQFYLLFLSCNVETF